MARSKTQTKSPATMATESNNVTAIDAKAEKPKRQPKAVETYRDELNVDILPALMKAVENASTTDDWRNVTRLSSKVYTRADRIAKGQVS